MSDRPLNVYEVLRQEYERLHGDDAPPVSVDWDKLAEEDAKDNGNREATKVLELLPALFTKIHEKEPTALCFSGGGIRSATFSLGVMQRLARMNLLQQFDYLSTVSGGGYIGSWLSSFVRRTPGGIDGVAPQLSARPATTLDPEPEQIRHLREYSNYLTPQLGLFSGDTWSLVGNYLRNLILNWLMLIPLLAAVLAIPRVVLATLRHQVELLDELKILTLFLFAFAVVALAFLRPVRGGLPNRKPYNNGGFLLLVVLPFCLAAIGIVLYVGWTFGQSRNWPMLFGALALTSALSSVIYTIRFWLASPKERRGEVTGGASVAAYSFRKLGWETIAAVISAGTVTGLLWASEKYLFNDLRKRVELPTLNSWETLPAVLSSANAAVYVCFAVPLVLGILFAQSTIFVGLSSRLNEDYDREWWARAGGWVLVAAVAWIGFTGITIYGPVLIYLAPRIFAALGAGTGAFTILFGRSGRSGGAEKQKKDKSMTSLVTNIALALAAPIFAVCILALISLVTSKIVLAQSNAKFITDDEIALYSSATYHQKGTVKIGNRERVFETDKYPAIEKERLRAIEHLYAVDNARVGTVGLIFLTTVFAMLISFFIGVNKFSMHAFYRNRLIRAYLGASRHQREPNPFTGFDPNDNIQMHKLRGESFWVHSFRNLDKFVADLQKPPATKAQPMLGFLYSKLTPRTRDILAGYQPDPARRKLVAELLFEDLNRIVDEYDLRETPPEKKPYDPTRSLANRRHLDDVLRDYLNPASSGRPFHIVNMALNLVSGDNLAWQQRNARTFTVSPLHSGSYELGYRASREYGGPDGISLGTSVAISGAAASPNMGYHSSPALSFLLTLFNVRLGWWLGNPGRAGNGTYRMRSPLSSLKPLIAEVFGMTDDKHPYIYLSDGGHFENLGFYEMVLRRCRSIVVIDAGADENYVFDDLGNAVRKIRIDLGIPITVQARGLYPRRNVRDNPKYCAVGEIDYTAVDGGTVKGRFLYIKPAFYEGNEPRDVYNYARTSDTFPHESTGDQWFSESQFESYRALGDFALESIVEGTVPAPHDVDALINAADAYIRKK